MAAGANISPEADETDEGDTVGEGDTVDEVGKTVQQRGPLSLVSPLLSEMRQTLGCPMGV